MIKKVFIIAILLVFPAYYSFSQTNFDLNGIWISYDYSCYDIGAYNGGYKLAIEVFKISQDSSGNVIALKCMGDNCVPAGSNTWTGSLNQSDINGYVTLGSPDNPAGTSMPVHLQVINDSLIKADAGIYFLRINCQKYKEIAVPEHGNYYDCGLCLEDFEIPNVFTPNRDGVNDLWEVTLQHEFILLEVEIYNCWGNLEKSIKRKKSDNKRSASWNGDGTNGELSSSGVYYYIIKYYDNNSKLKTKTGFISLFR